MYRRLGKAETVQELIDILRPYCSYKIRTDSIYSSVNVMVYINDMEKVILLK